MRLNRATIGAIPVIGQIFDFYFKANSRNIRLMREHYLKNKHQGSSKVYPLQDCEANFIKLIDQHRPHVVMLDFRSNGEKCMEILETIKASYPTLPVIAMSCNSNINTDSQSIMPRYRGFTAAHFDR